MPTPQAGAKAPVSARRRLPQSPIPDRRHRTRAPSGVHPRSKREPGTKFFPRRRCRWRERPAAGPGPPDTHSLPPAPWPGCQRPRPNRLSCQARSCSSRVPGFLRLPPVQSPDIFAALPFHHQYIPERNSNPIPACFAPGFQLQSSSFPFTHPRPTCRSDRVQSTALLGAVSPRCESLVPRMREGPTSAGPGRPGKDTRQPSQGTSKLALSMNHL